MRSRAWILVAVSLSIGAKARATANLPSEDPAWDELRDAIAEGRVPDPLGGVQSLGADRVFAALSRGRAPQGWWATPVDRAILRTFAADERDRPYSLPLRDRHLAGFVAPSSEYQEARPLSTAA